MSALPFREAEKRHQGNKADDTSARPFIQNKHCLVELQSWIHIAERKLSSTNP